MRSTHWTPTNAQLVAALRRQYPQLRTGRPNRAILEAFPQFPLELDRFTRIPDAFAIYPDRLRVDLFECEVTHPLSRSLVWDIADLWLALDIWGIEFEVFVVNRYGHINQFDLPKWYLRIASDDVLATGRTPRAHRPQTPFGADWLVAAASLAL